MNSTMALESIDIVLSSSLETDQSSETTLSKQNMDIDKNISQVVEEAFHFLIRKSKKILTSLGDFIIMFKRVVHDQFIICFRSNEIERTRVYHVWPGNNVFFFNGRVICGPDPRGLILTFISITLSSWTFVVHVASDKGNQSIVIISLILTAIVLINLMILSSTDPGIIPINDKSSLELGPIRTEKTRRKVIHINGIEVKLKYCRICNIYRPPRSSHCAICNNCIEKFDHHCPWIGHCIGLRNYRSYIMFLFNGSVLFVFMFIFSCKRIHQKLYGDGISVTGLLGNCPETLALSIFSFAALCFLVGLSCFNIFLVTLNQTAYENFHQKYVSNRNPYNKGIVTNIKEVLFSSLQPPRVNFEAEVEDGWVGGYSDSNIT